MRILSALSFLSAFGIVAFMAAVPTAVDARKCNAEADKAYRNRTFAIKQAAVQWRDNGAVQLKLNGNFTVVDGCTFALTNFTFLNSPPLVYWYGLQKGNEASSRRLSDDAVIEQNGAPSVNFSLSTTVGREVSWDDVSFVRLYSESAAQVIAEVDLTGTDVNGIKSDAASPFAQFTVYASMLFALVGGAVAAMF